MKKLINHGINTINQTYVIAEIGINHGGNLAKAFQLIESAARTGCDAVKFQTYITEKRAPKGNDSIFKILKQCELPFSSLANLQEHAKAHNVEFFSTPFDVESIEALEKINASIYKVASFDLVNKELLRALSDTGKTIICSVGMGNLSEIHSAVDILTKKNTSNNVSLLHCISAYPTNELDSNLRSISQLIKEFPNLVIGQSDHTNDIKVPTYAVCAGAQVIEKHFKIDEKMDCIDAAVSITESQMRTMVDEIRKIEQIFGENDWGTKEAERTTLQYRRPSN